MSLADIRKWRTRCEVLHRLRVAAKEPPSYCGWNYKREPGDIFRTVIASDLQELLNHYDRLCRIVEQAENK